MKAERRHELKENDLLQALNNARKYLDERGRPLGIALIVAVIVLGAVTFSMRSRAAAVEDVWRRRAQLSFEGVEVGRESLDALARMTDSVSDKRFILSSLMEQGQQALRLSSKVLAPPDPDLNERAGAAFRQLLERFPNNPLAVGVARLGLATVQENEFAIDGDFSHKTLADEQLGRIIDDPAMAAMPFMRLAMDRRERLDEIFTRLRFAEPEFEEPADTEPDVEPVDDAFGESVDEIETAPVDEASEAPGSDTGNVPPRTSDADAGTP
jgi:hypothetical protein